MIQTTDISGQDEALIASDNVEYCGFSLRESGGASSATIRIHNGNDNTGDILDVVELNASESAREYYEEGLEADGIYIDVVSGSVEGSIRWRS